MADMIEQIPAHHFDDDEHPPWIDATYSPAWWDMPWHHHAIPGEPDVLLDPLLERALRQVERRSRRRARAS